MTTAHMTKPTIVSREEWIEARKAYLTREKEFTKLRDQLSADRRALPWVKVTKPYVFDTPDGKKSLSELFQGRTQLVIYHFMYGPDWAEGCPSCAFVADHMDGAAIHLKQRDVTLMAISRAPLSKIEPYKKRMGWSFPWASSFETDFNADFHVSFTKDDVNNGTSYYNYQTGPIPAEELHGLSVFFKDGRGQIFHTYSTYARGCDILVGTYNFLDLVPKGRDEDGLAFSMSWVRPHDRYPNHPKADASATYAPPAKESCCLV